MRAELLNLRARYATAQTPDEGGRAVLETIARLREESSISLGQASVLLYVAADHTAASGQLDPNIADALRDLFVDKKMNGDVVRAFREQWFSPYAQNLTAGELDAAWADMGTGRQTDRLRMQKIFALAAGAGELTPAELDNLRALAARTDLDPQARSELSAQILRSFVASLDRLGADPELQGSLVADVRQVMDAHPDDVQLASAAQDLFFRARADDALLVNLSQVFDGQPDLRPAEWAAVLRLVSGADGRIDESGMRKILLRIAANEQNSPAETDLLAALGQYPKNDAASRLLADWCSARDPDHARTDALGTLQRVGRPLLGNVGALQAALEEAVDGIAIEQVGIVLRALDRLATDDLFTLPLAPAAREAVLNALGGFLAAPVGSASSDETGQLLLDALVSILGDRMSAIGALEDAGALRLVRDGGPVPGQSQRFLFAQNHAYALTIQEDLTFALMDIDLDTGARRQVKLPVGMSVDMPTMVKNGQEILVFGIDAGGEKCVVSYDTRTGAPSVARRIALAAGSIVEHPEGALIIGDMARGGPPSDALKLPFPGEVELVEDKVHSLQALVEADLPLCDVWVQLNIEHAYPPDLKIQLVAPDKTTSLILKPSEDATGYHGWHRVDSDLLSDLMGESIQGEWTLQIEDTLSGDAGRLADWAIAFGRAPSPSLSAPEQLVHRLETDGSWKPVASLRTAMSSAVSAYRDSGQTVLVGSAGLDSGSNGEPVLSARAPVILYDPRVGETGALPSIDLPGFSPEAAWVDGDELWVSGSSFELGTKNPRVWHMLRLSLDEPMAAWCQIDTGGNVLVNTADGFAGVVGGHIGTGIAADIDVILPVEGARPAGASATRRKVTLAHALLDGVRASGRLTGIEAESILDILDNLHRDEVLTDELCATVERTLECVHGDSAAMAAFASRWYGAGRSPLDRAYVDVMLEDLRRVQTTCEPARLLRDIARACVSSTGAYELLKLDWTRTAPEGLDDVVRLLATSLAGTLETLVAKSTVSPEEVSRFAEAAGRLRRLGDAPSVDAMVRRLLFAAKHTEDSADRLRGYLGQGVRFSPLEARLAVSHFEQEGGQVRLAELRAVAAMTDSDGVRDSTDSAVIDRLSAAYLSKGAREKLSVLTRGVTYAADLAGDDPVSKGGKVDGSGNLVVWARENRTASKGEVYRVGLESKVEARPDGVQTSRVHVSGRTILDTVSGHQPFVGDEAVTSDSFDQVQALWTANEVLSRLERAGIDLDSLQQDEFNGGKLRLRINGTHEVNAWYDPETNEITFGTAGDKWHLGSDSDVVAHEIGHYVLDHINRDMEYWGDSGAVHEAFGDIMAALLFNDPEISEDFGRFEGGVPIETDGREGVFLRNIENDLSLDDVTEEVHDRGRVFAGYLWSLKQHLSQALGDDGRAADLMFAALVKHPFFYMSTRVTRADFLEAIAKSVRRELEPALDAAQLEEVMAFVAAEANRRKLDGPPTPDEAGETHGPQGHEHHASAMALLSGEARPLTSSGSLLSHMRESVGRRGLRRRNPRPLELARVLNDSEAVQRPDGVSFVPIKHVRADSLSKMTFQGQATDPSTGTRLRIEDGYVGVLADRGELVHVAGGGTRFVREIDWSPIADDPRMAEKSALRLLREFTTQQWKYSDAVQAVILSRGEEIFSHRHCRFEEVIFNGRRCLKTTNACGVFIVDVKAQTVKPKRVLIG